MFEWMRKYLMQLKLRNKILLLLGLITAVVAVTIFTDIWVGKVFMFDLRENMDISEQAGNLVQLFETETDVFRATVRAGNNDTSDLKKAMRNVNSAMDSLPEQYVNGQDETYALVSALRQSYEVYVEKRHLFLNMQEDQEGYLTELYEIYDMQSYLNTYANELMVETSKAGNQIYQKLIPQLVFIPAIMLIISVITIFFIIQIVRVINSTLIEPILILAEESKKIADNDFSGKDIPTENHDEMANLIRAFNKMKFATRKYIEALEEKRRTLELLHAEEMQKINIEKQLEQMKFEALQNQMNPHFLFNTLNVIGGMANLEDADITEKMIKALSNLFRYNMHTEEVETTLDQDIKVVEDYLYLQRMRFGERLKWKVDYDPQIGNYLIPTFMFQPFVENSIVHGLAPKIEGGKIMLNIRKEDERLVITLEDTGVGMDQETLSTLMENLTSDNGKHRGIGVGNIYRRLKLMYEDSTFDIQSEKGVGTKTIITIPAKQQ